MKQRIITAALIILAVVPPLLMGGVALQILVSIFAAIAVYEIASIIDKRIPWYGIVALFIVVIVLAKCHDYNYPTFLGLFIVSLFVIDIFTKEMGITKIAYLFLMSLLFSTAVRGLFTIDATFGTTGIMYVAVVTYGCDTAAYFIGSMFGKRKLIPRVSPNKTVEGAVGGFVVGFIASLLFGNCFLPQLPFKLLIVSSILLPIAGQIGDLAFSSIKRHFNQKDFGSIFPGHGGVLDRIDSLLFDFLVFNSILSVYIYLGLR